MSQQLREFLRKELEQQGYTFHPGRLIKTWKAMRFEFDDKDIDCKPSPLAILNAYGWVIVDGGIMEPPKPGLGQIVLRFAAVGALLYGAVKVVDHFWGDNS